MDYTAAVITVSDKGFAGERKDTSGPCIVKMLAGAGYKVVYTGLVPDDRAMIEAELVKCADEVKADLVLTTGGTGFSTRDVTPEATLAVADRLAPGIPEAMRYASMQITPRGMLSRSVAGLRGTTLIINLPGSEKGAHENLDAVLDTLEHALNMVHGGGHENSCKSCADN
jgi:molybdopterin adenylyltransferase